MILLKDSTIPVTGPIDVAKVLQGLLTREDSIDQDKEHFYALHLDARNRISLVELVSIGTVNASLVHPRELFRRAVQEGAVSIIVAHNHPSGETTPSDEDITSTRNLCEAGRVLGISVLDHIIFSSGSYTSFAAECII